jgi:adenylate cyclase
VFRRQYIITFIVLLLVFNASVALAALGGHLSWGNAYKLFWGQFGLTGLFVLGFYAKHLVIFFALLVGLGYVLGVQKILGTDGYGVAASFWAFYSLLWLVYFEIRKSPLGQSVRLSHPVKQFFFYLVYLALSAFAAFSLTAYVYYGRVIMPAMSPVLKEVMIGLTIAIPTFTILMLKVVDMIGARHFLVFLSGAYHRPVERRQIVLFLDMIGSTTIAEKLSPARSMEFIARFIFDACYAFRIHGGDVVQYTGDGLVVLWPVDKAPEALRAVHYLRRRIETGRAAYERNFGGMPDFRAGIHAGHVVLSQIGEEKLFLGLYGDDVNVAARIEQACKTLGVKLLFSGTFRQRLSPEDQKSLIPMGRIDIKGREQKLEVFTTISEKRKAQEKNKEEKEQIS